MADLNNYIYIGAANTSRAKSFMSLHKNLCMNAVRRSSRSFSDRDRKIDFDVVPWPSNKTRPNIVADWNTNKSITWLENEVKFENFCIKKSIWFETTYQVLLIQVDCIDCTWAVRLRTCKCIETYSSWVRIKLWLFHSICRKIRHTGTLLPWDWLMVLTVIQATLIRLQQQRMDLRLKWENHSNI